jgi:predicted permease
VALALLWVLAAALPLPREALFVIAIVVVMPVSVTSTVITEKMNQDTALAAQAVLYSTLCSLVTVPLMVMLARSIL